MEQIKQIILEVNILRVYDWSIFIFWQDGLRKRMEQIKQIILEVNILRVYDWSIFMF